MRVSCPSSTEKVTSCQSVVGSSELSRGQGEAVNNTAEVLFSSPINHTTGFWKQRLVLFQKRQDVKNGVNFSKRQNTKTSIRTKNKIKLICLPNLRSSNRMGCPPSRERPH